MTTNTVFGVQTPQVEGDKYNSDLFQIQQALAKVCTATPVRVIACSNNGGVSAAGTLTVQPLINQMTGNRLPVPHLPLYKVPYCRLQGGANAIILDPVAGDIGLVGFCQRDIGTFKNAIAALISGAIATVNPGSFRQFNWADGVYLGGMLNTAPTQYIQFAGGSINVASPAVQATGNLSVGSAYTGTFTTPTGQVVTVIGGIVQDVA